MNNQDFMKTKLYIFLIICFAQELRAQDNSGYRIVSSNMGSSGSSQNVETSNGIYKVSQSIGQASVIGTHATNGYILRQGYQQPLSDVKRVKMLYYSLQAKVYPNPFSRFLTITFSDIIRNDISVKIFDINAKVIHTQEFLPAQEVELNINTISIGTYFLKVTSGRKHFNTKLIKI
jgi:hypothetical protein